MDDTPASPYQQPPAAWHYPPPAPAPRQPSSGLAIAALVVSVVALVGVLGLAIVVLVTIGGGIGGQDTLTGSVSTTPQSPLAGADLASSVRDRIGRDGGDVSAMDCPSTPKVDQGVVTVCHGTIDDDTWAVVVFFEDTQGRFTLAPL